MHINAATLHGLLDSSSQSFYEVMSRSQYGTSKSYSLEVTAQTGAKAGGGKGTSPAQETAVHRALLPRGQGSDAHPRGKGLCTFSSPGENFTVPTPFPPSRQLGLWPSVRVSIEHLKPHFPILMELFLFDLRIFSHLRTPKRYLWGSPGHALFLLIASCDC